MAKQFIETAEQVAKTSEAFTTIALVSGLDHDRVLDTFERFSADELRQITDVQIGVKMVLEANAKYTLEILEEMKASGIEPPPADFSRFADHMDTLAAEAGTPQ